MGFAKALANFVNPEWIDTFTPLDYKPTPRQEEFHKLSAEKINEILYGGAAGGGKSCAFTLDAIKFAVNVPGIKIAAFRRTYPELEESFLAELAKRQYAKPFGANWNGTKRFLNFPNGSLINFSYAENIVDATRIQGGEYQIIYIDESSLMPAEVIQMLAERLRSSNRRIPVYGLRLASNPGGISHQYLKDRFVLPTKRGREIAHVKVSETSDVTRSIAFVPAKATDNPHLDENYGAVLDSIADPQRRALMRDGDWDAMVGQFFEQWNHYKHVVPYFPVPKEWRRYSGVDYGYRAPYGVVTLAVDEDGRLWVYREIYATQVTADNQAKLILEAEKAAGETENVRVGDPAMWGHRGTPLSIADIYGLEGCGLYPADNDRVNGWARVHHFLNDGPACEYHRSQGLETCPMLHVFEETCPMFIKTIPALPRDPNKPDDALTKNVDDHLADALRYVVMAVGSSAAPIIYDLDPKQVEAERNTGQGVPEQKQEEKLPTVGGGAFVLSNSRPQGFF